MDWWFDEKWEGDILGSVLNALPDGFSYTNEEGEVVYANRAYYELTGLTEDEILNRNVRQLADQGYPVSKLCLDVFQSGTPKSESIRYSAQSGREILITATPVYDRDGVFRGAVITFRDLDELIALRRELETTYLRFEKEIEKLDQANQLLQSRIDELMRSKENGVVAKSRQMRDVLELAYRVGQTRSTVLITGESGVGKDVICQAINRFSGNRVPYMKISCGAIPDTLLESELFGYEPGAFSGASRNGKMGIFELAGDGIVFLDEIGEMPLHLQVKLLTVLQDRCFFRVGGTRKIEMNAQVVAATNRNLKDEVDRGSFRKDLYYRLNVVPITICPLRERQEDIIPLAEYILSKLNEKHRTQKRFSAELYKVLPSYRWPGNVRELNNVVERMYVLSPAQMLDVQQLPAEMQDIPLHGTLLPRHEGTTLKERMERVEAAMIEASLEDDRTLQEIADSLGIDLSTLIRKIKRYHLPRRHMKKD